MSAVSEESEFKGGNGRGGQDGSCELEGAKGGEKDGEGNGGGGEGGTGWTAAGWTARAVEEDHGLIDGWD